MRDDVTAPRLRELMRRIGQIARAPARVYLVGGTTAVFEGWRDATIDVDLQVEPDSDLVDAIARLKDEVHVNIEFAGPSHFIPEVPGWRDRSPWIETIGKVSFHHYDPYSQALAKIERGHQRDAGDVAEMTARGWLDKAKLWDLYEQIEPRLGRYAIQPESFRAKMEATLGPR